MSKERDWVDYAELGLSAAQTARMSEMASELGRIRETAAAKDRQTERVRKLRLVILCASELLDSLEADSIGNKNSLAKHLVALHQTEEMLTKAGVLPPTAFHEWEDMERASKLGNRIETLRSKMLNTMTDIQRGDAERCMNYMAEESDLKRWIMLCGASERTKGRIDKANQIEQEIENKLASSLRLRVIDCIGNSGLWLVGLAFCLLLLCAFEVVPANKTTGMGILTGILAGCALYIGKSLVLEATGDQATSNDIKKLTDQLSSLRTKIREEGGNEASGEAISSQGIERGVIVPDFYAEKSSTKLRALWIARREFIHGIMGAKTMTREMDETGLSEIEKVETDKLPERVEIKSANDEPISVMNSVGRGVVLTIVILAIVAGLLVLLGFLATAGL